MDRQTLKEIILEQRARITEINRGIEREELKTVQRYLHAPHVIVIAGIRRCGKSTLLFQIMDALEEEAYYFNFEEERLIGFQNSDFNHLVEVFLEVYGERKIFLLDEIQNVSGWERFVRRMTDRGYKFIITGSNASLLSRDMGSKLTGRHLSINLYPFSFLEYLRFFRYSPTSNDLHITKTRGKIKRYFNDFLKDGGLPEYLQYKLSEALKKVYDDILFRDIVVRYDVKEVKSLRELSVYLTSNLSTVFSYNSLKNILDLGSANTVKSYIEYLENSFLFFVVNRYSESLKKQLVSPKKIYCIDNGLANNVSFKFSENKGRFLENAVFLALKRSDLDVYYYKTKNDLEVDFLVKKGVKDRALIQVCWSMAEKRSREREIKSTVAGMEELGLSKSLILTDNDEEVIKINSKTLVVKPVYKWLLESKAGF